MIHVQHMYVYSSESKKLQAPKARNEPQVVSYCRFGPYYIHCTRYPLTAAKLLVITDNISEFRNLGKFLKIPELLGWSQWKVIKP